MTLRTVHRPARQTRPVAEPPGRTIEAPPVLPEGGTLNGLQALLPVAGATSSVSLMLLYRGSPLAGVGALIMGVTVVATGLLLLTQRGKGTRQRKAQRERYLEHLSELRERFAADEQRLRSQATLLDPPPAALLDVVRDPRRLWERRRRDADFLRLRLGSGALPGARLELADQGSPMTPTDPFLADEARAVQRRFSAVPALPLCVPLDRVGDVSIVGPRPEVLGAVRTALAQLAAFHAPEDVAVAVVRPHERAADWAWTMWLPHLADPRQRDATGPIRRIADGPVELVDLLGRELTDRLAAAAQTRRDGTEQAARRLVQRLVVVVDSHGETSRPLPLPDRASDVRDLGMTVLHLVDERIREPEEVAVRVTVDGDGGVLVEDRRAPRREDDPRPDPVSGTLDEMGPAAAEALARLLSPLRLSPESHDDGTGTGPADFPTLLGVDLADPNWDPTAGWVTGGERDLLRVPLGVDDNGRPLLLDLKEAAQLGMGPHGLAVGATGSGKSELLRTLVLSLALTHAPDALAMILVDFKGGASFTALEPLPHVAGVITNLAGDAGMVQRAYDSLAGEVRRRQQVLADAGNIVNLTDYELVRRERGLPPLPHLVVVIDEFGELLVANPDFIELFLSIGRIGRSIGVHLLLSSQRLEGGGLRGLDTYLSYRIGLRTFSEAESRTVLDTTDAYNLPPLPGFGYLKVDTSVYSRFKAAYVSGPVPDPEARVEPERPVLLPIAPVGKPALPDGAATRTARLPQRTSGPTLLSAVVDRLSGAAEPVLQIWLPPLPEAVPLDRVAGPPRLEPDGLALDSDGRLQVPLGIFDDPGGQRQDRWDLDLTRGSGHVVVIGAPRTGRTTLLRTLALGLATTCRPGQVAIYGVDLLGAGLAPLAELPQVGGVAGRGDRERVRRTLEEVRTMVDEREALFRSHRIDSVEAMRAAVDAGRLPLPVADVVLLVDGYGQLGGDFEDLAPLVHDVLARGGAYGVHVVASVTRFGEVRTGQQAAFANRIELRLGDPADSLIDRKLARTIRADQPGRALRDDGLLAQVALPRLDGSDATDDLAEGLVKAAIGVAGAWAGDDVPAVRTLPAELPAARLPWELPGEPATVDGVPRPLFPIGLDERDLAPVVLDLGGVDQHVLVLGDPGAGKTCLMRLLVSQLVARFTDEQLVLAVFDPRRRLTGVVPEPWLGGYADGPTQAAALAASVAAELERRRDGTVSVIGAGPGSPPRVVLLVDDYDVLEAAGTDPLAVLRPHLASGRDIGVHLVLTRRVAGAGRGLFDRTVLAMREAGGTTLVMSGDRSEGQLVNGVRAMPLPPGRALLSRPGSPPVTVQLAVPDGSLGTADAAAQPVPEGMAGGA